MAYLVLKSNKLNITKSSKDDLVILGQVVDSQSSYEIPKKITSVEDLIKWFGNSFDDYEYLCELLNSGATLLLYKPISKKKRTDSDSYIDYSGYDLDSTYIYDSPESIPFPEDRVIYRLINSESTYIWDGSNFIVTPSDCVYKEDETVYKTLNNIIIPERSRKETIFQVVQEDKKSNDPDKYIWIEDLYDYVNISYLPQNTSIYDKSISWNNRDTLDLVAPELNTKIKIGHSRYSEFDIPDSIKNNFCKNDIVLTYKEENVENRENYSYAFSLNFDNVESFTDDNYICLYSGPDSTRIMLYFAEDNSKLPKIDYITSENRYRIEGDTKEEIINNIWGFFETYNIDSNGLPEFKRIGNSIWSNYSMPVDYFYKLPGFSMEPDKRLSWDIISQAIDNYRIRFTSRTIGKCEEDISIKIEKLNGSYGRYQVTIDRDGYGKEIHVGNIFPNVSEDPDSTNEYLEYVINRDSELVRVKINQYYTDSNNKRKKWSLLNPDYIVTSLTSNDSSSLVYCTTNSQYYKNGELLNNPDLPVGTWYLKGSELEEYSPEDYQNSLNCFIESEIPMDFLMIPDINVFRTTYDLSNVSWYPEYEVIQDFCKTNNTQALISNNDTGTIVIELPEKPDESLVYKIIEDKYCIYLNSKWYSIDTEILSSFPKSPKTNTIYQISQKRIWTYSSENGWNEVNSIKYGKLYSNFPSIPRESVEYTISKTWYWKYSDGSWKEFEEYRKTEDLLKSYIINEVDILPENPSNIIYYVNEVFYKYVDESWEIQSSREICNTYLNEFVWNYIKTTDDLRNPVDLDKYNYLVYFYRKIFSYSYNSWRPGYYAFLEMILLDNHNYKNTYIHYDSPVEDPLDFEIEVPLETLLENKKSNYLVENSNGYYYKKYFNHTGNDIYTTSILTRFFQSYLSKRFSYYKWNLLGARTESEMISTVENILDSFVKKFYLVAYATLDDYSVDYSTSTAEFEVIFRSKELVDRNINLYITLNYTQ